MGSLNHAANNERQARRDRKRSTMYAQSVAAWGKLNVREQTRFLRIASEHAHENRFCASVGSQTFVSAKQAGVLMKLATERGWSIPTV